MIFIGKEVFLLRVLGTYGPTTIALFITGIREKKKGVVELLESFRRWKVGIFWYLFSLFSTAVLTILSIWIYLSLERNNLVFNELSKIYLVVPVFLFVLIFSVLGEEIGWRGFALPKLQEKIGPLRASLLIGVVWGSGTCHFSSLKGIFIRIFPFGSLYCRIWHYLW